MAKGRKQLEAVEQRKAEALRYAANLVDYLRTGGPLQPARCCTVRLDAGETPYFETSGEVFQHCAANVSYTQSTVIALGSGSMAAFTLGASAIGNSVRRQQAEVLAAPQWRSFGIGPLVITDRRLLGCVGGRWLSWWFNGIRQLYPHIPGDLAIDLLFDDCPPTRLQGLGVPYLAVILVRLLYGQTLTWNEALAR